MLNLNSLFGRLLRKEAWWALRPRFTVLIAVLLAVGISITLLDSKITLASAPTSPMITEPYIEGKIVYPGDVHMEAVGFSDSDGNAHACSDWEIRPASSATVAWKATCASGAAKVHIHLGDGQFINDYQGRTEFNFDTDYILRVRFVDSAGETSEWSERTFRTKEVGPAGVAGDIPFAVAPGFKVEQVTGGLQLPVNIAFVPNPGSNPSDPFFYVTELLGTVKLVTRDGTVSDCSRGLVNFDTNTFQEGLAGIVVEPTTGDLFVDMVVADPENNNQRYPRVIRLHNDGSGCNFDSQTTILNMAGVFQGSSHQVSNISIGPDGKLYVHNGDGFFYEKAQDLDSFLGKILRMNFDGTPADDNPFYNAADGINAKDYVFAYGFRNPWGGDWRASDGSLYEIETGPNVDRFAKVISGRNYLYDGTDESMRQYAIHTWGPPDHAPPSVVFIQPETNGGSGFPANKWDHAFVAESGSVYATGPASAADGKRITEIALTPEGTLASPPTTFLEYTGVGKATIIGLAAGPDGLYFTDFYKDLDATSLADPGARVWRVRYVGGNGPP